MNHRSTRAVISILAGVILFVLSFSGAYADNEVEGAADILYTSAPNPVGSGARALGMGGAFISVADDATAASWNPAGLVQLKRPEFSIVGSFVTRSEAFDSDPDYGILEGETVDMTNLNYLSVVLPFSLMNRNMAIALNYQHLYDYSSKGHFSDDITSITRNMSGSLSPLGIAYSLQVTPKIKWGVTFNFWNRFFDENRLKETYQMSGMFEGQGEKIHQIKGFNLNTGILWSPSEKTGIGAIFKSPFTADINARAKATASFMGSPPEEKINETHKELAMPLSFGIGGHYKVSDFFKISMDIYQTNWNQYFQKDENGKKYSAVTGLSEKESHVDPTRQVRAGMEYLIVEPDANQSYPLRMGIFYDPIPDKGSPVDAYGGSLGAGLSTSHFAIDGFYQYKFSTSHSSMNTFKEFFPESVKEHQLYLSFIFYL